MRILLFAAVVIAVGALALNNQQPPAPSPEQQAIAELRSDLAAIKEALKPNPAIEKQWAALEQHEQERQQRMEERWGKTFAEQYPDAWEKLSGIDNATSKIVESELRAINRIDEIKSDLAKLLNPVAEQPPTKAEQPEVEKTADARAASRPTNAYDAAVMDAKASNRKVLFILSRDGCGACKELEVNVIDQSSFQNGIKWGYVLCPINVSHDKESAMHFTVSAYPAALVYDPKSNRFESVGVPTTVGGIVYVIPPKNVAAFISVLK